MKTLTNTVGGRIRMTMALLAVGIQIVSASPAERAARIELEDARGDGEVVRRHAASHGKTRRFNEPGQQVSGEFSCPPGTYYASVAFGHRGSPARVQLKIDGSVVSVFNTTAVRSSGTSDWRGWEDIVVNVCLAPITLTGDANRQFSLSVLECDRWGIELDYLVVDPRQPGLPELPITVEAERPGRSMPRSAASGFSTCPLRQGETVVLPFVSAGGAAELEVRYSLDADPCKVELFTQDGKKIGEFTAISTRTGVPGEGWGHFRTSPRFALQLEPGPEAVAIRAGVCEWNLEVDFVRFRPASQSAPSGDK